MTNQEFQKIPQPPQKPDPMECCMSGCVPCVYDYYYQAVEKWEAENLPLNEYLELKSKFQ